MVRATGTAFRDLVRPDAARQTISNSPGCQPFQDVVTSTRRGLSGRPKLRARAVHPKSPRPSAARPRACQAYHSTAPNPGGRAHPTTNGRARRRSKISSAAIELDSSLRHRSATSEAFATGQPDPGQVEQPPFDPRDRQRQVEQIQGYVIGCRHSRAAGDH